MIYSWEAAAKHTEGRNSLLTGKWQQRILVKLCKLAWKDKLQRTGSSRRADIALPTHPPNTA